MGTSPNLQGWEYQNNLCSPANPEASVFIVSPTQLEQNTLPCGFAGSGESRYRLPIAVTCPFRVSVRAKLLGENGNTSGNPFGFGFGVNPDGLFQQIGMGSNRVRVESPMGTCDLTLDTTSAFHDFQLRGDPIHPEAGVTASYDGTDVCTLPWNSGGGPSNENYGLFFGDETGGTHANVQITAYSFTQACCGDGLVELDESCDLGTGNCGPADTCDTCTRSCTNDCKLSGRCTGSQTCCTTAADCGPGEGCCGNGVVESGEACDDGNRVGGDTCTPLCQVGTGLPLTCCPRGSEIAGATVLVRKKLKITKLGGTPSDEQLKSGGEAILLPGQEVHPCTEGISYCIENAGGIVYGPDPNHPSAPQVAGTQMKQPCRDQAAPRIVSATYKDAGHPPVGSEPDGVKQFSLKNVASQPNKFKYKVLLRDVNLSAVSPPMSLRQSLIVGDTCLVLHLACTPAGTTTAICVPSP